MNRQNNLKVIITTVIVLVIAAIAVFTVVNWAEIVQKFKGTGAKLDGIEKHERNTVPPSNSNTLVGTTTTDDWKDLPSSKEDNKSKDASLDTTTKNTPKDDYPKTNPRLSEKDPYGLEEPPIISPKDSGLNYKYKHTDEYSMGNESSLDSSAHSSSGKKTKLTKTKKYSHKKYRKKHKKFRSNLARAKGLDKRVSYLEKKLGIKKQPTNKKVSLEKRIYQLEKLIIEKKK